MKEPRQLQSLLDPSDTAIEIVEPYRQTGEIAMQPRNLALDPAEPDDDLVKFLAQRCLLGSDRLQHAEDEIGSFVAHNLITR